MTTLADAIKAGIEANWNVGSGGTEPPVYNSEDYMTTSPTGDDWIMIHNRTYRRLRKRQNDTYVGERYSIEMRVSTKNDANAEERLDTMTTELYRIVTPDNVTGFNEVDIVDEDRSVSENNLQFYQAQMIVEVEIYSTASAAAAGAVAAGTPVDALTMYGSANAAWVPILFMTDQIGCYVTDRMIGLKTDPTVVYLLPYAFDKGALSLHLTAFRIYLSHADANNYIDRARIFANKPDGTVDTLFDDGTNQTATGLKTYTPGATLDLTGYEWVLMYFNCRMDTDFNLRATICSANVFYDT